MRTDRDRLEDILNAAGKALERSSVGREAFLSDEMLQVWMIHHLEVIGEAVYRLSKAIKDEHLAVPWRQIAAIRHILIHE
jgi:uncharacterized protein with HEPN domain